MAALAKISEKINLASGGLSVRLINKPIQHKSTAQQFDMQLQKNRFTTLHPRYLAILIPLVVGCQKNPTQPITQISIDKVSSVYDSATDSTTTTHTTVEVQDSNPFWKSVALSLIHI